MKRCPQFSRVYADDALNFCLDDGGWLVETDAHPEPVTAILSGDPEVSERTDTGSGRGHDLVQPIGIGCRGGFRFGLQLHARN